MPFSFNGTRVHAAGAGACESICHLRVRGGMSMVAVDENGVLVGIDAGADRATGVSRAACRRTQCPSGVAVWLELEHGLGCVGRVASAGGCMGSARHREERPAQMLQGAEVRAHAYPDLEALGEAVDGEVARLRSVVFVDCAPAGIGSAEDAANADVISAGEVIAGTHGVVHRVLDLVKAWVADERFAAARLVLVTRGAVAAGAGETLAGVAQSPVWGLVRCAQLEHPGRLVLVDTDDEDASSARAAYGAVRRESQLALRAGRILAPRLTRLVAGARRRAIGPRAARSDSIRDGTVLITGGTGALGALVARHLVAERGVGHVLLASRRGSRCSRRRRARGGAERAGCRGEDRGVRRERSRRSCRSCSTRCRRSIRWAGWCTPRACSTMA